MLHKPQRAGGSQDKAQGVSPDHALMFTALVLPETGKSIAITDGDFNCPLLAILRENRVETQREISCISYDLI